MPEVILQTSGRIGSPECHSSAFSIRPHYYSIPNEIFSVTLVAAEKTPVYYWVTVIQTDTGTIPQTPECLPLFTLIYLVPEGIFH